MLSEDCFKKNLECRWCGRTRDFELLYTGQYGANVLRCKCGFVFSDKILNKKGLREYWDNYESVMHNKSTTLVDKRRKMYQLECEYILRYIDVKNKKVLDVGCAGGEFLDVFHSKGAICVGVEFGKEAADIVSKKYKTYVGEFSELNIEEKFDLIIFRGVIQYFTKPKEYFEKAVALMKDGGALYITCSPNTDSTCFNLFKERFTNPIGVSDCYGYNEKLISRFLNEKGLYLLAKYYFYLETPYCDIDNDIKIVAEAINNTDNSLNAPAFFDNMLTLVYTKKGFEDI